MDFSYFQSDEYQALQRAIRKWSKYQSAMAIQPVKIEIPRFADAVHFPGLSEAVKILGRQPDFLYPKKVAASLTPVAPIVSEGLFSGLSEIRDILGQHQTALVQESLVRFKGCLDTISFRIPAIMEIGGDGEDGMGAEMDISDEFYDSIEPVLEFLEREQPSQETGQAETMVEKVKGRAKTLSVSDVIAIIGILVTIALTIAGRILPSAPVQLDESAMASIQSIESAAENTAEDMQQIIDLLEDQNDLANRQIALLQSINDSLERLAVCMDEEEEPEEAETVNNNVDGLQEGEK